ncbi:hypothetical protein IE53DRAFT_390945, partial [Violaceomyces palustris]
MPPTSSTHASSAKERHYSHLAARLAALSNTFQNTHHHVTVASEQAHYVRKLAIGQAST